jgi:hypothetical protein
MVIREKLYSSSTILMLVLVQASFFLGYFLVPLSNGGFPTYHFAIYSAASIMILYALFRKTDINQQSRNIYIVLILSLGVFLLFGDSLLLIYQLLPQAKYYELFSYYALICFSVLILFLVFRFIFRFNSKGIFFALCLAQFISIGAFQCFAPYSTSRDYGIQGNDQVILMLRQKLKPGDDLYFGKNGVCVFYDFKHYYYNPKNYFTNNKYIVCRKDRFDRELSLIFPEFKKFYYRIPDIGDYEIWKRL